MGMPPTPSGGDNGVPDTDSNEHPGVDDGSPSSRSGWAQLGTAAKLIIMLLVSGIVLMTVLFFCVLVKRLTMCCDDDDEDDANGSDRAGDSTDGVVDAAHCDVRLNEREQLLPPPPTYQQTMDAPSSQSAAAMLTRAMGEGAPLLVPFDPQAHQLVDADGNAID